MKEKTNKLKKKYITVDIGTVRSTGTLHGFLLAIKRIETEYKAKNPTASSETLIVNNWDYGRFRISNKRLETDEEAKKRIKIEEQYKQAELKRKESLRKAAIKYKEDQKKKQEVRKRALYEKLKKEYEGI